MPIAPELPPHPSGFLPAPSAALRPPIRDAARRAQASVASRQWPRDEPSGDLAEFADHGDGVMSMFVADVAGNGAEAAPLAMRVRALLAPHLADRAFPGALLARLNEQLQLDAIPERLVTAASVRLDLATGDMTFAGAGHLGPFVKRAGGVIQVSGAGGPPLGLLPRPVYPETGLRLAVGDTVVLVTDGISDGFASSLDPLGGGALAAHLTSQPAHPAAICRSLSMASHAPHRPDATVLALRFCAGRAAGERWLSTWRKL
jgi:sigma-B regulation protein RsbU (phosphoserine phosphatase)